ncbi:MAG: hypothetical protein NZ901_01775 [Geminocystis sp.]|nr:hypothetical protein [Geminocystis sp.]HIK36809.1 hypothetical protein [Geminocystis sp. M7585_C2015_104]MCS7146898.1 hypothetical protein [Geminocystis sp.]MCX8078918.1 hypothetical protein [Geminocystis sp.]MDW8115723.1 hypothetical protein [Geminocystis sp.]
MLRVGMAVRVKNPEYARGLVGYLVMQESPSRWLVRVVIPSSIPEEIILSLEESDFEVIQENSL